MYIQIDHERILEASYFSSDSSGIGEQNLLFFPRGDRIRFYLDAADGLKRMAQHRAELYA
jgi:hypothetical protein